jgi:hypothetical protein
MPDNGIGVGVRATLTTAVRPFSAATSITAVSNPGAATSSWCQPGGTPLSTATPFSSVEAV